MVQRSDIGAQAHSGTEYTFFTRTMPYDPCRLCCGRVVAGKLAIPEVRYLCLRALNLSLIWNPRAREEELLYVLRKLLALKLWPGTLWAALSDSPSKYASEQPGSSCHLFMLKISLIMDSAIDQTLTPSALISDAVKRSTKAHLFHFYPILCEIVAIPRKPPTAWVMTGGHRMSAESRNTSGEDASDGHAVELDARTLVKDCLKEVGRELGVGH